MRDLLTDPAWRATDLGAPLPDSAYAVSVALPTWESVIGYEECDPALLAQLQAGYPRFFPPLAVRELSAALPRELGLGSEIGCAVYPTEAAARRCADYIIERTDGWKIELREIADGKAHAVCFPVEVRSVADDYWRYCGEGISGRQARELRGAERADPDAGAAARDEILERMSSGTGQSAGDVFLHPSGMAAVAAVHRAITSLVPGRRSVQFDFPYVDVLRVQKEFGGGVSFLASGDTSAIDELEALMSNEELAGVYCEVPSNPLLRSANLEAIHRLTSAAGVPLVVDDTVATHVNIDVFRFADLVTTSLTKSFSGAGDVLAGAVTINGSSPLAPRLREALAREADTTLGDSDAIVLAGNSRDFVPRVSKVDATAPSLVKFLREHAAVERVFYPDQETPEAYDAVRRPGGGRGGLFSIQFKDGETSAPRFYDALRWSKGPSLGANFSLACPYTLLAHYDELDWCESLGVSRYLVRCSVGLEDRDELIARVGQALEAI